MTTTEAKINLGTAWWLSLAAVLGSDPLCSCCCLVGAWLLVAVTWYVHGRSAPVSPKPSSIDPELMHGPLTTPAPMATAPRDRPVWAEVPGRGQVLVRWAELSPLRPTPCNRHFCMGWVACSDGRPVEPEGWVETETTGAKA